MKLPKDIFEKRDKLRKELAPLNGLIADRLGYIFKTVYKLCEASFNGWYVDGAEEGELGDIDKLFYDDKIEIDACIFYNLIESKACIFYNLIESKDCDYTILLGKQIWYLRDSIPKRWLYEDFEEELLEGKRAYAKKKLEDDKVKAIKKQNAKQKKEALIHSVKTKLSKEEMKAIGIK